MSTGPEPSFTHLVIIPSYNTGPILLETVREVARHWNPVQVVFDGSTDGTPEELERELPGLPQVRALRLRTNQGKGAAVLAGMGEAHAAGFTHALVMDADGQHPAGRIQEFMQLSQSNPDAMVLGQPTFDASAPRERVLGRRIGNAFTWLETWAGGVGDSLFGFRVYPIAPSLEVFRSTRLGRGYDFDTQLLVRLHRRKVRPIQVPVPVHYVAREKGGVSHFRYVRHNALLVRTHLNLLLGMWRR